MPSTFTTAALIFCAILVAAGASMLAIYIIGGIALAWQLMVALAAAGAPPLYDDPEIVDRDDHRVNRDAARDA